ncbi:MAG: hypothetical protein QM776_01575 [Rhodocyclaceae bacterium]
MGDLLKRLLAAFPLAVQDLFSLRAWRELLICILPPFVCVPVAVLIWLAQREETPGFIASLPMTGWLGVVVGFGLTVLYKVMLLLLVCLILTWPFFKAASRAAGARHGLRETQQPAALTMFLRGLLVFVFCYVISVMLGLVATSLGLPDWLKQVLLIGVGAAVGSAYQLRMVTALFIETTDQAALLRRGMTKAYSVPLFQFWPRTLVCMALAALANATQLLMDSALSSSSSEPFSIPWLLAAAVLAYLLCLVAAHVFLQPLSAAMSAASGALTILVDTGQETLLVDDEAAASGVEANSPAASPRIPLRWQVVVVVLVVVVLARSPLVMLLNGFNPASGASKSEFETSTYLAACTGKSARSLLYSLPGVLSQDQVRRNINCAASSGHLDVIKHYCRFACSFDPAAAGRGESDSPLYLALISGNEHVAEYLAARGAPLDKEGGKEGAALAGIIGTRGEKSESALLLLKRYPHLAGDIQRGYPAARMTIMSKQGAAAVSALERLEELGVGITHMPQGQESLLQVAVFRKNLELVDWLLAKNYLQRSGASSDRALVSALTGYSGEGESSAAYLIASRLLNKHDFEHMATAQVSESLGESMLKYPELRRLFHTRDINFPYASVFSNMHSAPAGVNSIALGMLFDDMNDVEFKSALDGGAAQVMAEAGLIDAFKRIASLDVEVEMTLISQTRQSARSDGMCLLFYSALEGKNDTSPGQIDSWQTTELLARRLVEKKAAWNCDPGRIVSSGQKRSVEQFKRLKKNYSMEVCHPSTPNCS